MGLHIMRKYLRKQRENHTFTTFFTAINSLGLSYGHQGMGMATIPLYADISSPQHGIQTMS